MANNPKVLWPSKFGATSGPWPYGEPKDIAAPGDATGSPWEVSIIKDIIGFQQALLVAAGIVPSQIPETAEVSQYLEAMSTLFPRSVVTTTAIGTTNLSGVQALRTLGFTTAGDGGEAAWYATGVPDDIAKAGTQVFDSGLIYDNNGKEFAIFPGTINPRQYGAKGDGTTNDLAAIQSAIETQSARNGGLVFFTPGTYRCDSQVTLRDLVSLGGTDVSSVTLTFAGASGAFPDGHIIFGTGSTFILPVLGADVPHNAVEATFALAHGLDKDALILFIDPRDFSFSSVQDIFRSGEFAVVGDAPTTTTVRLTAPVVANNDQAVTVGFPTGYEAAEIIMEGVLPIRTSIRNMSIIGTGATSEGGIAITYGRDCAIEGVKMIKSLANGIVLSRCYETFVTDVQIFEANEPSGSRNGVILADSQRAWLTRVTGISTTSLILLTVDAVDGNTFPNRFIYMQSIEALEGGRGLGGIRIKGNSEFIYTYDSRIHGYTVGGDNTHIFNSVILGQSADLLASTAQGQAMIVQDIVGFTHSVNSCRFEATLDVGVDGPFIKVGGSVSHLAREGQLQIAGCTIDMLGHSGEIFEMGGRSTTQRPDVLIRDNHFIGDGGGGQNLKITVEGAGPAGCRTVEIRQNSFVDCNVDVAGAEQCRVNGNLFIGGYFQYSDTTVGFSTDMRVEVMGNFIRDSPADGIFLQSRDVTTAVVIGNTSLANANSFGSIRVDPTSGVVDTLILANNVFGDDQAVPTQSYAWSINDVTKCIGHVNVNLGGLTLIETGVGTAILNGRWNTATDIRHNTGDMEVHGGTMADSPQNGIAMGDEGHDVGIYIRNPIDGNSKYTVGDSNDDDRFEIEYKNDTDEVLYSVGSTAMLIMDPAGLMPGAGADLGRSTDRWDQVWGNNHHMARMRFDGGTDIVVGDFALDANWGSNPSVSFVDGKDTGGVVEITTGTGSPSSSAQITFTFTDGTMGSPPESVITNRAGPNANWAMVGSSATSITWRIQGTPSPSVIYRFNFIVFAID